ncbi:MAG: hypothetical protein QXP36_06505 [Conexivisphaerales archaeon]
MSHNWREFWIDHTGDISAKYSTYKVLPQDTINAMRETHLRCEINLTSKNKEVTQDEVNKGFRMEFLSSVIGVSSR